MSHSSSANCSEDPELTRPLLTEENEIQLDSKNMVMACLPSREKLLLICDSGASQSLISASAMDISPYLSQLVKTKVNSTRFLVGNGHYLQADYSITFKMTIQDKTLTLTALVTSNLAGVDVIVGTKSLKELGCTLNFANNVLTVKAKSIVMQASNAMSLKPGQQKMLILEGKLPKFIRKSDLMFKINKSLECLAPKYMMVRLKKGKAAILLHNGTNHVCKIKKKQPIGTLDLSSVVVQQVTGIHQNEHETVFYHDERDFQGYVFFAKQDPSIIDRNAVYDSKSKKYPFLDREDPNLN